MRQAGGYARAHGRALAVFGVLAAVLVGGFLWAAAQTYRVGFPLDDAWIHQTYARHLVRWGAWAYRQGGPSAGATAPLWVVLQAVGQALGIRPWVWNAFLGWATLTALGYAGWAAWRRWFPEKGGWWPWAAGVLLVTAWHLVWAALSGMETALFALALFVLTVVWGPDAPQRRQEVAVGMATAGAAWLRPEALVVAPVLAMIWLLEDAWPSSRTHPRRPGRAAWRQAGRLALGVALGWLPYLAFNLYLAGHIWPNTFYAKQAEYAILRQLPLWRRAVRVALPLFAGMGALAAPWMIWQAWQDARARQWRALVAPLWVVMHWAAYVLRLPVNYQHGRYVLPVLPVVLWMGWRGLALAWPAWQGRLRAAWLLSRAWAAAWVMVGGAFLLMGAHAYGEDVAVIESEMVDVALWMDAHLPPSTIVAAHDIGALGYFTDFPLVDLAGLVSPEVIPIIRDEKALADFCDARHVQVLVAFPDWYAHLTDGLSPLYANPQGWGTKLGKSHLTVYAWAPSYAILWVCGQ